jgi:hypothetical protein
VAEFLLIATFVSLFRNTRIMSNPSRHSSTRSNRSAPLEEIVLPALSPVTPAPAPPPFFASPAPKMEAETANVFGSHNPWADVQATPTPRHTCPSTRHASCTPTPFVPKPLDSAYHWNDQTYATLEDVVIASGRTFCAGKHATLHNFRFIFRTSRLPRTLRFPYTEVPSFLGSRPVLDMVPSPLMYLWA